jgi:hypothetical protein
MGRKHREERGRVKASLRLHGWSENEFGKFFRRGTKADARRTHLSWCRDVVAWLPQARQDVVDLACRRATEDLQAEMDNAVFNDPEWITSEIMSE